MWNRLTLCLYSYGTGFSSCHNFENAVSACFWDQQKLRDEIDQEVKSRENNVCVGSIKIFFYFEIVSQEC